MANDLTSKNLVHSNKEELLKIESGVWPEE